LRVPAPGVLPFIVKGDLYCSSRTSLVSVISSCSPCSSRSSSSPSGQSRPPMYRSENGSLRERSRPRRKAPTHFLSLNVEHTRLKTSKATLKLSYFSCALPSS
jgi:hypothetical protein